jgi:hypothetical protein
MTARSYTKQPKPPSPRASGADVGTCRRARALGDLAYGHAGNQIAIAAAANKFQLWCYCWGTTARLLYKRQQQKLCAAWSSSTTMRRKPPSASWHTTTLRTRPPSVRWCHSASDAAATALLLGTCRGAGVLATLAEDHVGNATAITVAGAIPPLVFLLGAGITAGSSESVVEPGNQPC